MTMCIYANFDLNNPKYRDMMERVQDKLYIIHKLNPGLSSLPDNEIRQLIAQNKVKGAK